MLATGGPPSTVVLRVYADGTLNPGMGASDIGTKTVAAMVVAEEFGVEPDAVQTEHADTAKTEYASPSGGSKTVPAEAPTARRACLAVKDQLMAMAAQAVRGAGQRRLNSEDVSITPFAAQFCEVDVNALTGEVHLLRLLATNESRPVINRLTRDGQLIGGVAMGIGFARTEFRVLDGPTGKRCNKNWHDCKLPTALDVPVETVSDPVLPKDAQANILGARGLGEPVTIPTGPAIASGIFDTVGIRITDTPISPHESRRTAVRQGNPLLLRAFACTRPSSLEDAAARLREEKAQRFAGGTDLLGCLRDGCFQCRQRRQPGRYRRLHDVRDGARRLPVAKLHVAPPTIRRARPGSNRVSVRRPGRPLPMPGRCQKPPTISRRSNAYRKRN